MWLVVIAKSVSWLGDEVALVAMTLRLQSQGHGAGAVAALLIANLVPIVALSGPVGRLLDRRDNRSLLIASSLFQAAVCTVLAFASAPLAILGLVAVLGAGQALNAATWQALLPAIVGRDELPSAMSRVAAGLTLAGVIAPALGGLLTGWYGARVPLLIDAATFVVITAAALLMSTRRVVAAAPAGTRQHGGVQIVWHDSLLRPLFVLLGVFILLASMVNVIDVFLVRETLGASTLWYGLAGAAYSIGALTGAILGGRLRGPARLARGFVFASMVLSGGLAVMGVVPAVVWLLPCGLIAGAGNGVLNVALNSLVMGRARDDERGRVGALLTGVASGTQLIAFVAAGLLAAAFTPREIFVAAGVLGLLAPVVLGRSLLRGAAPTPVEPELAPAAAAA
jgi:MFS family permease